jgi:hypothetical protein
MEIADPSLGIFSLLPAEVRIMIWKHFSPQLHVGRSLPRKPNHLSRDQEILLTSRKIYAEVAAEVPSGYNDNTFIISVRPEYRYKSWIEAKSTKGVQWDLEYLPDAISRGFCELPWHNLTFKFGSGLRIEKIVPKPSVFTRKFEPLLRYSGGEEISVSLGGFRPYEEHKLVRRYPAPVFDRKHGQFITMGRRNPRGKMGL